MKNADYWIKALKLRPHPEGGFFCETYRALGAIPVAVLPRGFKGPRIYSTAIYFLVPGGCVSKFHRILSDEMWHFYCGSPMTLHCIAPDGTYEQTRLGCDPGIGAYPQALAPAGSWFGATVDDPGSYTLVGCTVAPGFDFADFELAARKDLLRQWPQHRAIVERLTPAWG